MAHKKAGGSTRNGRDSESKRLGVKVFGGEKINAGSIIVRQRGTKLHAGENVGRCAPLVQHLLPRCQVLVTLGRTRAPILMGRTGHAHLLLSFVGWCVASMLRCVWVCCVCLALLPLPYGRFSV